MSNLFNPFRLSTLRFYGRIMLFIYKWLMWLFSASIEIYLHRNFGCRYLGMLSFSWFFCVLCCGITSCKTVLDAIFVFGLSIHLVAHVIGAFTRSYRGIPEPHSHYTGDAWRIWQRWRFEQATVQRYLEPLLCVLIALPLHDIDPFLFFWLIASGISLFIREQIVRVRNAWRVQNAIDARLEAQDLNANLNRHQNRTAQVAQQAHQPHRARFPQGGGPPHQ